MLSALELPAVAIQHLDGDVTRLTIGGVIYKNDDTIVRCTQHDEDLEITTGHFTGLYLSMAAVSASDLKSGADMSVDNMEITGVLSDELSFSGFDVQEIEAGLFNNAPYETFLCQWDNPSLWQKKLKRGYLGEITRTYEQRFTAEWRGLFQLMQQQVGKTLGERCDVKRFGDARCGFDLTAAAVHATVASVTSNRRFDLTFLDLPVDTASGYFDLGEVVFTSGSNVNPFIVGQIKRDSFSGTLGQIDLWESLPYDVQVGDAVTLYPGCDRTFDACKQHGRNDSFRGHGRWIPGIPSIVRAP